MVFGNSGLDVLQIQGSANHTQDKTKEQFCQLRQSIITTLDDREKLVLAQVRYVKGFIIEN